MIRAQKGLYERQSLEDSCLVADGEDLSISREFLFCMQALSYDIYIWHQFVSSQFSPVPVRQRGQDLAPARLAPEQTLLLSRLKRAHLNPMVLSLASTYPTSALYCQTLLTHYPARRETGHERA